MSRIGKNSIAVPPTAEVTVADGVIRVKGPHGELSRKLHEGISVSVGEGGVTVKPLSESLEAKALWGTFASHIKNMLAGVHTPFVKILEVEGIGYRAELAGNAVSLTVGFSHPVKLTVPEGVKVVVEKNVITISGPDKETVGQFAAQIRAVKEPEPYKGKGIHYQGEVIRRKQGKRAVA